MLRIVCLLSLAALLSEGAAAADRPNVVFFLVDDLGVMDIGAYNPETFYETPHVDRLAAEGMRFTQGYAACPVCSPTRYSILTGKYPTRAALTDWLIGKRQGRFAPAALNDHMALKEVTLAESLRAAGYRTAFLGKWHLGPTAEFWPEAQGFEVNLGGHDRGSPPGGFFSPYKNPRLSDGPDGEHLPDRLASEACRLLEGFGDEPFLLYFSFYSVHTPLQGRDDLVDKYRAKAVELESRLEFADEEQVWSTDEPRKVRVVQNHAVYAAMVEAMDAAVGRVLTRLEELGLAENTIVCFTSDNGGLSTSEGSPTSNLPYRGGKGWLYEGGIREPFLIRWPGVADPGSTCDAQVCSIDFLPTLLEAAGAGEQAGEIVDGRSLVPLLGGEGEAAAEWHERPLYWHYPHYSNQGGFPGGAIRVGDWKLIERYEDGRVHLYNVPDDPAEQHDLADAEPERVASLRSRLHAWYKDVDARFLQAKDGRDPWRP